MWLEGRGDRLCLGFPRIGPGAGDDRQLAQHDRRVLYKNRIGQAGLSREAQYLAAERGEAVLIFSMLLPGEIEVDRLSLQVRKLAASDVGTDFASDGDAHGVCFFYQLALCYTIQIQGDTIAGKLAARKHRLAANRIPMACARRRSPLLGRKT